MRLEYAHPVTAILLLAAFLFPVAAGAPFTPDAVVRAPQEVREPNGRVEGRVVDPGSRAGIGGVQLRLDGRDVQVSAEDGTFALPGVPAGRHRLEAMLPGFAASSRWTS